MAGLTDAILQQVLSSVTSDPSLLSNMVEHPYSTIGNITNNNNVSKEEASQVVTALAQLAGGQSVNTNNIASVASQLMGQNNNSVHSLSSSLLGSLLGGGQSSGGLFSSAQAQPTSSLATNILGNLAGAALGSGGLFSNKSAIDLSDGFGLDDALGIASLLFGKK